MRRFQEIGRAARNLLSRGGMDLLPLAALALLAAAGACVIPLPYDEDDPVGGGNHIPVIKQSVPSMPGPYTLRLSAEPEPFSIDVVDKDVDDTIFVRVFRNYRDDLPSPAWVNLSEPPSGSVLRTILLPTNTWCNGAALDTPHYFTVTVADRPFDADHVPPLYKAVTEPGESSDRLWVLVCSE
jgi:hypothetical protein